MEIVIEATGKELNELKEIALKTLQKDLKVKGFRIGKVPLGLVQNFAGEKAVQNEILETAISFFYTKAISEKDIFAIGRPKATINKVNFSSPDEEIALEVSYIVSVVKISKIADGTKFSQKFSKEDVSDEEINEFLEQQREKFASYIVKDGEAENGDKIEINFEGSVNGIKKEKLASRNYPVVLGKKFLLDDFEKNLLGMKKGESKTFKMTFPKDYFEKEFAGVEVEFSVSINEVWSQILPNLDDEFAKLSSQGNTTSIENLKSDFKDYIKKNKNQKNYEKIVREFQNFLLENSEISYPESYLSAKAKDAFHKFAHQFEHMQISFETYLEKIKKSEEEVKNSIKKDTDKEIKLGFIFSEIVRKEKLSVPEKEVAIFAKSFKKQTKKKPTEEDLERFKSESLVNMIYEKYVGKFE